MNQYETKRAETCTDDQIRVLRDEAGAAGDDMQWVLCTIALEGEDMTPSRYEARFGGGGHRLDARDLRTAQYIGASEARRECARTIADAWDGMDYPVR